MTSTAPIAAVLTWHYDAAHAWLKVPIQLMTEGRKNQLAALTSSHSFRDDTHAYLEEDCDAPRFIRHYGIDAKAVREVKDGETSPIRQKTRWRAPERPLEASTPQPERQTVKRVDIFGTVTDTYQTEAELNGIRASQGALF